MSAFSECGKAARVAAIAATLICGAARAGQGTVQGATLTSAAFPVGTITVDPHLTYVGHIEFVLYDIADCEIHLWVDAPGKRVKRLYWVQFESYLPNNNHTYDYSDLPVRTKLGGREFFNGVRFFNLDEEKTKWRAGSDYERVLQVLGDRGYTLGPEVSELALFRVDGEARRELMIVYLEDLEGQGLSAAKLADSKSGPDPGRRAAAALRKRGLAGIRLQMQ